MLPRPPKSAEEVEEFRRRRLSSGAESITRSMTGRESNCESSDEDQTTIKKQQQQQKQQETKTYSNTRKTSRKESTATTQSEFDLELPDADDSLPLADFNEKCKYLIIIFFFFS